MTGTRRRWRSAPAARWEPASTCASAPAQLGRITRLIDSAPERDGTTHAVELDSCVGVHLADVASIGPATRPRRRDRRDPRLAQCAHAFGYRGHCLTKSRRYSTGFKALREARQAVVHAQILARSSDATQRAIAATTAERRVASFEWVGTGHVTAADAYLAAAAAARACESRRAARAVLALAAIDGDDPTREDRCRSTMLS